MNIKKQDVEKVLGYEINDFEVLPSPSGETQFNVKVTPKKSLEFVIINFQVLPTGAKFDDDER